MAKVRRTRKEKVIDLISEANEKIQDLQEKLNIQIELKANYEKELVEIEEAEAKAAEEAREKDLLAFIKKNNITKEQLQAFITAKEAEV